MSILGATGFEFRHRCWFIWDLRALFALGALLTAAGIVGSILLHPKGAKVLRIS